MVNNQWWIIGSVFLGGGLGSILRFYISGGLNPSTPGHFPWGTFTVNLLGCFLIGIFYVMHEQNVSVLIRPLILIGLLGGLTTFSSFGLECVALINNKGFNTLVVYILGSQIFGILCVWIGMKTFYLWLK